MSDIKNGGVQSGGELQKRFTELAERAETRFCYVYTDFLDQAQQSVLAQLSLPDDTVRLWGGHGAAERRIACFGRESECGYTEEPPLACLHIAALSEKFADKPGHRDYLGALLNLGIRREMLGDILVGENDAYLFCKREIAGFICEQLARVSRTSVSCEEVAEAAADHLPRPARETLIAASCRLDALIAAVFKLSRGESKELVERGRVFLCDRSTQDASVTVKAGDKVSVRGYGRFFLDDITGQTQKGRLRVSVSVYR